MRGSLSDALHRAYLGFTRGIVAKANDQPKMQTLDIRGNQNELITGVERFQHYGHSSVPLAPDQTGGKAAEAIVAFINGNRSNGIVLGVDDRRYRPTGGEPGQNGHYHYRGATATFRMAGFSHVAGPDKKPHLVSVGATSVTSADGAHTTKVGGTTVLKEDGKITTDTTTKIFTNAVHLEAGGSLSI